LQKLKLSIGRTTRVAVTVPKEMNAVGFRDCADGMVKSGENTVYCVFIAAFERAIGDAVDFTDRYMKKKKKKKKEGYDSAISCYILIETGHAAEDAITCQHSTSHSVWAAGFVQSDDGFLFQAFVPLYRQESIELFSTKLKI